MAQSDMNLAGIPITVRIIGNPVPVANKIFGINEDNPKTEKFPFPKSIQVGNNVECRLKEYICRNEVDSPQDLLLFFGVIGTSFKSDSISNFLYERLKDFKKITLIVNKQEINIDHNLICKHLEKLENKSYS